MFMLDTNIVSDAIKNPSGITARRIAAAEVRRIRISVIVAGELRAWVTKRDAKVQAARLEEMFGLAPILPLDLGVDVFYGNIRADLERRGIPIGGNDLFIAAHVLSLGATLVTDNVREFARVEGLLVENWLRD